MILFLATVPDGYVFGLDQQTLIGIGIQLFNACVLAGVLTFILYKPVRKFLKKRTDTIEGQLRSAEEELSKANELKVLYENKLAEIQQERLQVLEAARVRAVEKSKQIEDEAEKAVSQMREQVETDIQNERERAGEEMKQHIIDIAVALAEKFVAVTLSDDTQNKLFDEAVAQLESSL